MKSDDQMRDIWADRLQNIGPHTIDRELADIYLRDRLHPSDRELAEWIVRRISRIQYVSPQDTLHRASK